MKKLFNLLIASLISLPAFVKAQNTFPATGSVGIGTSTPNSSSILDMKSTSQGVLVPRMTKAQRDGIVSPATGLLIFQTNSTPGFYYYAGGMWTAVSPKGINPKLNNLLAPTAINVDLLPESDEQLNLGSSSLNWRAVHTANLTFKDGTNQTTAFTPYVEGPGISITGNSINNKGDIDPDDDLTDASAAGGDLNGTFSNLQLNLQSVGEDELADHSVNSTKIKDGSILGTDINEMSASTGQVLQFDGISWRPGNIVNAFSGTDNYLAKFSADSLANSVLFESGGNLMLGTTNVYGKYTIENSGTVGSNPDPAGMLTTLYLNNSSNYGEPLFGIKSEMLSTANTTQTGVMSNVTANESSTHEQFGLKTLVNNPGKGNSYGLYSDVIEQPNSTSYGAYLNAPGSKNYAAYCVGRGYFSGRVGINQTNPEAFLHINGKNGVMIVDGTNPFIQMRHAGTDVGFVQARNLDMVVGTNYGNGDGKLVFRTNSVDRGFVTASGDFVIAAATGAVGYRLSVGGKIMCEEMRVQNSANWPDYVFHSDYSLLSLPELKSFVEANKHLPGVPDKDEVKSNGIEVGEMQKVLLQKIEELTLYIISQDEKISDLQQQVSSMK